jgi:F0F1-type ATP synthase alpha subunit
VSILFAGNKGFLDDVGNKDVQNFKEQWFEYFATTCNELADKINSGAKLEEDDMEFLKQTLKTFKDSIYKAG